MLKNPFSKKLPNTGGLTQSNESSDGTPLQKCIVRFLDDSFEETTLPFKRDTKGCDLMKELCLKFDLVDVDYFGLRYVDIEKQRHWLDLTKTVYEQLKNVRPKVLCFRVKFYPSDPVKVKHEQTRYYFFLQLRRDLYHGRLLCTQDEANLFAAYIIQSDIGDYEPSEHLPGYVARHKMLPKYCEKQEEAITEYHKTLRAEVTRFHVTKIIHTPSVFVFDSSQTPADVELKFLAQAAQLDTYGIDPHPVKDQDGIQMYLGVTHRGIITFQGSKRKLLYIWAQVTKITFEGKVFIVHVTISEKKHACGFKCPTVAACKHLWKCAIEQQYFYTLKTAAEAPKVVTGGGMFMRRSKFRMSGRSEAEMVNSPFRSQGEPRVIRSTSNLNMIKMRANQSFGSLPSHGLCNTSLDSFGQYDGAAPSIDGDLSVATSPDQSVIMEEDSEVNPNQFPLDSDVSDLDISNNNRKTNAELSTSGDGNCAGSPIPQHLPPNPVVDENHSSEYKSLLNGVSVQKPVLTTSSSRLVVFAWVIFIAIFSICASLAAFAFVILEFDTDTAILSDIQRLPEICAFRRERYVPWREWFLGGVGSHGNANRFKC